MLALLNTLSAYRAPFHAETGQGAYQSVVKLLFGLYISAPASDDKDGDGDGGTGLLSARGLETLDPQTVEGIWNISTFHETPHPDLPGVTVGTRGGVMHEIVGMVVQLCRETGRVLRQAGWGSLGQFVESVLERADGVEEGERADWVVQQVSGAFFSFFFFLSFWFVQATRLWQRTSEMQRVVHPPPVARSYVCCCRIPVVDRLPRPADGKKKERKEKACLWKLAWR